MVNSYIGCGKISPLYFYILYSIIFKCLNDFILSFGLIKNNTNYGLFFFETELNQHILIKSLYKYISFIIFGIILLYTSNKSKKDRERGNSKKLIHKKTKKLKISKASKFNLLLICFIYVYFLEFVEISYSLGFHDLDLWIFNIVFAPFFISRYFSIDIYKHQKYSLLFIFFTNLFLIIFKSFFPKDNNAYDTTSKLFNYKLVSIVIYIIYIINSFLISFSRVMGKSLMEIKYISPYFIIIIIGIVGLILTSISIYISGNYKCISKRLEGTCNIYDIKNDKNIASHYYDSISLYFSNLKYRKNNNKTKFWVEVLIIIPLKLFFNFMTFNYEILIVYYLNPIYFLMSDSLYYGTLSLLSFIINFKENDITKSILELLANFFAFIGYLIYVEIIELKFCELDKNLRKAIRERSILDLMDVKVGPIIDLGDTNEEAQEDDEDDDNDNEKTVDKKENIIELVDKS